MPVISAEEPDRLREWVRSLGDEWLPALAFVAAAQSAENAPGEERADWFRLGRLVEEERSRRELSVPSCQLSVGDKDSERL